jgi:aryl-alcohol dehydrogenase-like predicted oxidoreductase
MPFISEAPLPPTALGRYRTLSKHASVYVSPLILGTASIGDQGHMGGMEKESDFKLLDAYFKAGGNFIDTANN